LQESMGSAHRARPIQIRQRHPGRCMRLRHVPAKTRICMGKWFLRGS
jgi:hypothetical protein